MGKTISDFDPGDPEFPNFCKKNIYLGFPPIFSGVFIPREAEIIIVSLSALLWSPDFESKYFVHAFGNSMPVIGVGLDKL